MLDFLRGTQDWGTQHIFLQSSGCSFTWTEVLVLIPTPWMVMMEEPPEMDRRNPFCHLLNAFLYQTHRSPKCPTLPVKEPDVLKAEGGYVYRSEKWDNFQTSSRKKGITQVKGQREQQTHFPGVFFFLSLLFYFFPSVSFKTETLNVLIRLFFFSPEHWYKSTEMARSVGLMAEFCHVENRINFQPGSLAPWGHGDKICFVSLNNRFYS